MKKNILEKFTKNLFSGIVCWFIKYHKFMIHLSFLFREEFFKNFGYILLLYIYIYLAIFCYSICIISLREQRSRYIFDGLTKLAASGQRNFSLRLSEWYFVSFRRRRLKLIAFFIEVQRCSHLTFAIPHSESFVNDLQNFRRRRRRQK